MNVRVPVTLSEGKPNAWEENKSLLPDPDQNKEEEEEYHADTVLTVLKPVSLTMLFVVWAVKTIDLGSGSGLGGGSIAYAESDSDTTGTKVWKALLNAVIVLIAILVTTVIFVILYKYRCLKIIYGWLITSSMILLGAFGGGFLWLLLNAWNIPMDAITFCFVLWNFAIVGIMSIFWHAPTKVNQGYLILISGLLAIFFSRLPEWTTFAILAIVAIYDIVAVLAPCGPLRMLVETAQERQEPIPALLYNASVFLMMADREEVEEVRTNPAPPPSSAPQRKGVKLGLGDFIFYSVLIGRAALFDMITVFTCFVGIITGLFLTLLLLAVFRKALPALPLSIALGILFYLISRIFLLPYVMTLGATQIFV